jgi:hypothetical protein
MGVANAHLGRADDVVPQVEDEMKKATKHAAKQIQQALLALPPTILLETIDRWLKDWGGLFEDIDGVEGFQELFDYRARSDATGHPYVSLEELFEAEPETEAFTWVPPTAQALQNVLRKMQPTEIYHGVVTLAGEVLRQKCYTLHWGEPPGAHSDGYAFMRTLVSYLELRKVEGDLPTEQFEQQYQTTLEALGTTNPDEQEDAFPGTPHMLTHERAVHFRVAMSSVDEQQRASLRQALQQLDCMLSPSVETMSIEGRVFYVPGRRTDLETLRRVRRLLNRWQRRGRITWTQQQEKPPKRLLHTKHKRKARQWR